MKTSTFQTLFLQSTWSYVPALDTRCPFEDDKLGFVLSCILAIAGVGAGSYNDIAMNENSKIKDTLPEELQVLIDRLENARQAGIHFDEKP